MVSVRALPSLPGTSDPPPARRAKAAGRALLLLLTAALLAAAGGCTRVGPEFHPPGMDLPRSWLEGDHPLFRTTSSPKESRLWWRQFHDPVLDSLITRCFHQNLTLQTAALRIIEARARLGLAAATVFPQVQEAKGSLGTIGQPKALGPPRSYDQASFGFDLGWELDLWGKYARTAESARAAYLAAVAGYDDLMVSLSAEVARLYIEICTLEERIRLAEKNVAIQESGLALVMDRFKEGTITELDVLQAKGLLAATRATIPPLRAALATRRHALAVLLGMVPGELAPLLSRTSSIPKVEETLFIGAPADLLRRRPDVRRAEMAAAAQCARIGIAKADLLPSFTLVGSLSWNATDAGSDDLAGLFGGDNVAWVFGPSFVWKLFHYGRLHNQVRIQDARYQQLLSQYRQTVLNAAREVEDGLSLFWQSRQEAAAIRQSLAASQKAMELSLIQYEEGLIDYQRVLESTRSVTRKQDQYALVRGKIATSAVFLYKALGGGWDERAGRPELLPAEVRRAMEKRTDWGGLLAPAAAPAGTSAIPAADAPGRSGPVRRDQPTETTDGQ